MAPAVCSLYQSFQSLLDQLGLGSARPSNNFFTGRHRADRGPVFADPWSNRQKYFKHVKLNVLNLALFLHMLNALMLTVPT